MDSATPRQRGNPPGPTAATVAENLSRVRFARKMTQQALSERLTELGRPIPTSSIGKIEAGLRTIDVDDLMALSLALDVSPLGLLMPRSNEAGAEVEATGRRDSAEVLWAWGVGAGALTDNAADEYTELSLPRWLNVGALVHIPDGETARFWRWGKSRFWAVDGSESNG